MQQLSKLNAFLGLLLIIISIYVFIATESYPASYQGVSPAFFPRMIALFLAGLGLISIIREFLPGTRASGIVFPKFSKSEIAMVALTLLIILYIRFVAFVGFIVATTILLITILWVLGDRRTGFIILFSLGLSICVYFIMRNIFFVPLPEGIFSLL